MAIHLAVSFFLSLIGLLSPNVFGAENSVEVGCPQLPVESIERSLPFFSKALEFKVASQEQNSGHPKSRVAHLSLGDECLDLIEYSDIKSAHVPVDSRANDLWFQHIAIVVSDMDLAYKKLRKAGVRSTSNVPQTLPTSNVAAAGISAFYFLDPDGHSLELIHFPPGKGQKKWQEKKDSGLFLGIDHTAITVSNTASSLEFYQDRLHLMVVGGSENFGVEQDHLNGVFNSHVIITSLRGDSGIGIEFLEFMTPQAGRALSKTTRITDLVSWQIPVTIGEDNLQRAKNKVSELQDPDGHRILLRQKGQTK